MYPYFYQPQIQEQISGLKKEDITETTEPSSTPKRIEDSVKVHFFSDKPLYKVVNE